MADAHEVLKAARELIADPEHWTTAANARDGSGAIVDESDNAACKWCAMGALNRVEGSLGWPTTLPMTELLQAALRLFSWGIVSVNDGMGHDSVMAIYDEAIRATDPEEHDG